MKTNLRLGILIVITLISLKVNSQIMQWSDGTIVTPDKNVQSKPLYVRYGEFSSFQITDINLFLYNVSISGKKLSS